MKSQDNHNVSVKNTCIRMQYLLPLCLSLVVKNKVTVKCGLLPWKGTRCATNKWPVKRKGLRNITLLAWLEPAHCT